MIHDMMEYLSTHMDEFLLAWVQHIRLSLFAFGIAAILGIGIGYLCVRKQKLACLFVPLVQFFRIIPSLAVLLLLLPLMGTGEKPALFALVLLAIPPILMNTITGFQSADSFLKESGIALGMNPRQLLSKVEIPQTLPFVLAGMKTSMLEIIASATIAAKIGAGGLGGLIFTGIGVNRSDLLLIGGGSVALLAIAMGMLLNGIDLALMRYKYIKK